jgi:hypothetical protein
MRKRGFVILLSAVIVGTCARLWLHSPDPVRVYELSPGPFLPNLPFNLFGLYTLISGYLAIFVIALDFIKWFRNRP